MNARHRLGRFTLALLPLAGCTVASSPQSPDGGTGAGDVDGGVPPADAAAATKPLSCVAIFDCANACNDDACGNACLARGSSEAQTDTLALAKCFSDHACTDAPCLQTNCQAEVDACLAQGQPMGTPLEEGGAVQGTVPASLVGSWVHTNYGETNRLRLDAAGTGYYQLGVTSVASCAITEETTWDGTVAVDATTITVYGTTVTNTSFTCGQKSQTMSAPQTLHF